MVGGTGFGGHGVGLHHIPPGEIGSRAKRKTFGGSPKVLEKAGNSRGATAPAYRSLVHLLPSVDHGCLCLSLQASGKTCESIVDAPLPRNLCT
jgi:hypothetical protein